MASTPDYLEHVSERLAEARQAQVEAKIALSKKSKQIKWAEKALMPEDGWPGKNVAERDASKDKVLLKDKGYQKLLEEESDLEGELWQAEQALESVLDKRRSAEWAISHKMAEALGTKIAVGNPTPKVTESVPTRLDLSDL